MCVCLVWVRKRKEGESCGERGVVTETWRHQSTGPPAIHSGCAWSYKPQCASTYYYYLVSTTPNITAISLSCLSVIYLMHQVLLSRSSCRSQVSVYLHGLLTEEGDCGSRRRHTYFGACLAGIWPCCHPVVFQCWHVSALCVATHNNKSCKCACVALYALFFIRNYFHTRCLAICADQSSQL